MQVAALNVRSEADAIAKRLTSKGYATYVVSPPRESADVPRPRRSVPHPPRSGRDGAARLQHEEQFKPWVTR